MLNLGFFELTLFGIIALIVLGPDKLPVAARTLGRWYGNIRRLGQNLQNEIGQELQILETQEKLKAELELIKASEIQMKAQMQALQASLKATHQQIGRHQNTPQNQNLSPADTTLTTRPMTNLWFVLGDYDRRRRLPPAPFMPNYLADPLLFLADKT